MKHHALEQMFPAFQPPLPVLVPEKLRVGETGRQHALVAGNNLGATIRRLNVGDNGKARRERAIGVQKREVFLVAPHDRGQDLVWQVHEPLVDPALKAPLAIRRDPRLRPEALCLP